MAEKGRRIDNGRYGKRYDHILTKEYLLLEYVKNNKSPYVIADEVGCNAHTVYNYIDYYKIPRINYTGNIEPGQNYVWLTTIKIVGQTSNGTYQWLCSCKCGKETIVPTSRLKNGRCKSCGCYKKRTKEFHHAWKGYCDISGNLMSDIRIRANKRGFEFNIDAQFLWELLQSQNNKCAISGLDIGIDKNASLDRIDSKKGYTKDNVWWVHKDVNKMKMDLKLDYFLEMCQIITKNKEQNDGNVH